MMKRTLWLGLILAASQLATGCCGYYGGWCNRPHILARPWFGGCGAPACETCGYGPVAHAAPGMDFAPPLAPSNPNGMPNSTPLTRR